MAAKRSSAPDRSRLRRRASWPRPESPAPWSRCSPRRPSPPRPPTSRSCRRRPPSRSWPSATYKTALTLPFIGGASANPVVKAFATTTMQQHKQHLDAFNAAITGLGGKAQTNPDPALQKVVAGRGSRAHLTGAGGGPGPRAGAGGGRDLRGRRGRPLRRQRQEGHRLDHGRGGPARLGAAGRAGAAERQRRPADHPGARQRGQPARPPPDPSDSPTRSIPTDQARPATEGALS